MDIPEDVKKKIEEEAESKMKAWVTAAANAFQEPESNFKEESKRLSLSFRGGAEFGYELSQSEIKELKEEVARLKGMVELRTGELVGQIFQPQNIITTTPGGTLSTAKALKQP